MNNSFLILLLLLFAGWFSNPAAAQTSAASRAAYMQIFYEGPNWMAGHEVLQYSPAYKGKTGELVTEGDDTRQLSPGHFQISTTTSSSIQTTGAVVTTERGTFVTGPDGRARRQTDEDLRKANQEEADRMNQGLQLLAKRSSLARAVLTKALNDAAADGWEVVQMTASSSPGSLVYLLRKR